ncbi:hypothetical protein Tco_1385216 [Tanacetum coccineum]
MESSKKNISLEMMVLFETYEEDIQWNDECKRDMGSPSELDLHSSTVQLSHWRLQGAEVSTEDANHKIGFVNLLHEDLEQIDDVDIEEMDINWQIEMIAIRMKKFYKKTGRRVRVDGKTPQKGHKMERKKIDSPFNNIRSWEAREESDGFADNGCWVTLFIG